MHRIARKELRRLLSGYASVDVVIAYRTPRVHVLHSLYTEEINEATTSQLATDAYTQRYASLQHTSIAQLSCAQHVLTHPALARHMLT